MDPFAALFAQFTPSARTFFTGKLCGAAQFPGCGHLHLLKGGTLKVIQTGRADLDLYEPTLLFFPHASTHGFVGGAEPGADLICATVDLGGEAGNPIGQGLPELVVLPLASHPALAPACQLLIAEAFAEAGGRQVALDRLFGYLLILIIRSVVQSGVVQCGVLAGLADPRLARALTALHEAPGKSWSLEDLAAVAGMSRTRFASKFKDVVGRTPIDYLTAWRMTIACQSLAKGKSVKSVAAEAGYDSAAAFSRVFARVAGQSPRAWSSAKGIALES
jgi:AraC-like DNA-binding protein